MVLTCVDASACRYPAEKFNAVRAELDPKNILANDIVDALFPRSESGAAAFQHL